MFDPFDAFDPIDPVPAAEPEREPFEPGEEPEPTEPRRRPTRRWTTTASRPVQPSPSSPRPKPEQPTARSTPAPSPPDPADAPPVDGTARPCEPTPSVPSADLTSFRAAALSELRAAVERLRAHGHVAAVTDGLLEDEPTVMVRFRPEPGPLAASSDGAPEPARFELRIASDHDGGAQVVAGYARGSVGAPFTLLGRTHVDQIDRSWVARRFIEFIQRVLELT